MRPSRILPRLSHSLLSTALALTASFSLLACGGGGGAGPSQLGDIVILSTPDLDGPVSNEAVGTAADQRPEVGQAGSDPVHGLFSFDLGQVPTGGFIVSATLKLSSIGITGSPGPRLGGMLVIDQLNYGAVFPTELDLITDIPQSGVALWDDITTLGPRTFDVTEQVRADRANGRTRSQYQVRGLIRSDGAAIDLVTLAGAENRNGDEPVLTIRFDRVGPATP